MSLYKNINARKKAGTSRPKNKTTITKKAYANMAGSKEKNIMDKNKKNKIKKVSKALVKASKLHAGQAKVLKKIIKKKA